MGQVKSSAETLTYSEYRGHSLLYSIGLHLEVLESIVTGNDLYQVVRRRIMMTSRAREYQEDVATLVEKLPLDVRIGVRSVHCQYIYWIPASRLETVDGDLYPSRYDLTNLTKPTEDALFRQMGIDDALVVEKTEGKMVSPDDNVRLSFCAQFYGENES